MPPNDSELLTSSPDPLNDTLAGSNSPPKRRITRRSLALQGSSPTKKMFELEVGPEASPQKLLVTVEAEGSEMRNGGRGSRTRAGRHIEKTTTTTVPVKGLSDTEDDTIEVDTPSKTSGRQRKSSGTPVPSKSSKSAATPPRRRKTFGDLIDGDDEDDWDFQMGQGRVIRGTTRRSRSRSRSRSTSRKGATPYVAEQANIPDRTANKGTSKKGRKRRESIGPEDAVMFEDNPAKEDTPTEDAGVVHTEEVLENIDLSSPKPFSPADTAIQSNQTYEGDEDVLLARFEPGNETPRTTGWSSPRYIPATSASKPVKSTGKHQISSLRKQSIINRIERRALSADPVPFSASKDVPAAASNTPSFEKSTEKIDIEADDEVGDLPEFDTILESEGFSMISVDTVPSLRKQRSSPTETSERVSNEGAQECESILPIDDAHDSDCSDRDSVTVASALKPQNPTLIALHDQTEDDSFSSIPTEILEAATPARNPLAFKAAKDLGADDTFSSIPPEILEAATPARSNTISRDLCLETDNNKEDGHSFPTASYAILEKETPTRADADSYDRTAGPSSMTSKVQLGVPKQRNSSYQNQRSVSNSSIGRLLTPEDSPPHSESYGPLDVDTHNASPSVPPPGPATQKSGESSFVYSHMRSSPPSIKPHGHVYTTDLHNQRELYPDLTQTPSAVFSSPSLPPPVQPIRDQKVPHLRPYESLRPALSPIARTGRVLQDIITPLPSSQKSQHLGSPFGSPVSNRPSIPTAISTEKSQESCRESLQVNSSIDLRNSSQFSHRSASVSQNDLLSEFVSERSFEPAGRKELRDLGLPSSNKDESSLASRRSVTAAEEDAMSWQADDSYNNVPDGEDNSGSAFTNEASAPSGSPIGISTNSTRQMDDPLMEFEQRAAAERAAISRSIDAASPSQVITIDLDNGEDELDMHNDAQEFNGDATSLLLETLNSSPNKEQHSQFQPPSRESLRSFKSDNISNHWKRNDGRLVYSDEFSQISHLSSPPEPKSSKAMAQRSSLGLQDGTPSSNPMHSKHKNVQNWHIPQKSNFQPRARVSGDIDISALLGSPGQPLPVLTKRSTPTNDMEFSENVGDVRGAAETSKVAESSSNSIPQKQSFRPRVREAGNIEMSCLFSSSPSKENQQYPVPRRPVSGPAPLSITSASRTNILQNQHDSSSSASVNIFEPRKGSEGAESWRAGSPSMAEFQNQAAPPSPTKSCLRSPEKSKSLGTEWMTPNKSVAFVSSSPYSSPEAEPLSSTTWSRAHWLLLDSIFQGQRPDTQAASEYGAAGKRRNSTRVISKLLGKRISAQGERMRLEQWHLEIVDEFRSIVPGWEEVVIAKRLFALIVGEKQRAAGYVGHNREATVV